GERSRVDHCAATHIDEEGTRLHERKPLAVEQMVCFRGERNMNDHHVAEAQELLQNRGLDPVAGWTDAARMPEHAHSKAVQLRGGTPPGAPEADDAAGQIAHVPQPRARGLPAPGLDFPVEMDE